MAGHSKWKNIQHRKGSQDAKRSKIFTKVGIELQVASKKAGSDPSANPRLRSAIAKARSVNMPNDMINRLIKKSTQIGNDQNFKEKIYEGFLTSGIAVIVECLTDNINRSVSDVRFAFSKNGGNLGNDGSAMWIFSKKGKIEINLKSFANNKKDLNDIKDKMIDYAIELDVHDYDFQANNNILIIITNYEDMFEFKKNIETKFADLEIDITASNSWLAKEFLEEVSQKDLDKLNKLLTELNDLVYVQNVYHNVKI